MSTIFKSLISASLLTISLSADSCDPCCPPPDPCASCAQLWPSRGPDWIVTPNAGPCVSCGIDLAITTEFIYWTAREDHLGFAATTGEVLNSPEPSTKKGIIFHPDWEFRPGFKIGLDFLTGHDGWDLYANYTWLMFHDIKQSAKADNEDLFLLDYLWGINNIFICDCTGNSFAFSSGETKWELDFNVIDVELGRNFFVSRCLQLRPHFGFKGTWGKQQSDISFQGLMVNSSTLVPLIQGKFYTDNTSEYWGIGLRTGIDSAWHVSSCFSLVGEAAITALWERFEVSRKDLWNNSLFPAGPFTSLFHTDNHFHTIKPILELYLALRWEDWFRCDQYHVSLEAGWEEQFWSDQNQFISMISETRLGDLILQGLTLKARFDF